MFTDFVVCIFCWQVNHYHVKCVLCKTRGALPPVSIIVAKSQKNYQVWVYLPEIWSTLSYLCER